MVAWTMSRRNLTLWIATVTVASLSFWTKGASAACQPCDVADGILVPCNSALNMTNWPGTFVFQPIQQQSKCACNQNFYDQMTACLTCQSSTTAHFSVLPLTQYQAICTTFGQSWQQVYIPGATTTSSALSPSGPAEPTNSSNSGIPGPSHSNSSLSSGAVVGIVVSAIALVVALSVAGYVFNRRRREQVKQREDDDLYKYQETNRNSYMEVPLPQYTGMIQPSLPSLPQLTNLRVMNPDSDDEGGHGSEDPRFANKGGSSFDVARTSSPGWRRGSFDDD